MGKSTSDDEKSLDDSSSRIFSATTDSTMANAKSNEDKTLDNRSSRTFSVNSVDTAATLKPSDTRPLDAYSSRSYSSASVFSKDAETLYDKASESSSRTRPHAGNSFSTLREEDTFGDLISRISSTDTTAKKPGYTDSLPDYSSRRSMSVADNRSMVGSEKPPSYMGHSTVLSRIQSEVVWEDEKSGSKGPADKENSAADAHGTGAAEDPMRPWLKYNLLAAKITVFLMFIVGIVNGAFGGVIMNDLEDDRYDHSCEYNYIADASVPWDESLWNNSDVPGRYHNECRLLYSFGQILTAACVFSVVRPFVQIVPAYDPTDYTYHHDSETSRTRLSYTSIVYLVRAVFSYIPCVLYLVCIVILGTSPLLNGPPTRGEFYRPMYLICMGVMCASLLISAHQVFASAMAGWYFRRCEARRIPGTEYVPDDN